MYMTWIRRVSCIKKVFYELIFQNIKFPSRQTIETFNEYSTINVQSKNIIQSEGC